MNNYKKGASFENKIERRLWNKGYATFRVAGSGTVGHASADLVAIKNSLVLVFEVKNVKGFPIKVDAGQLEEIEMRSNCDNMWIIANIDGVGERAYEPQPVINEGTPWEYVYQVI